MFEKIRFAPLKILKNTHYITKNLNLNSCISKSFEKIHFFKKNMFFYTSVRFSPSIKHFTYGALPRKFFLLHSWSIYTTLDNHNIKPRTLSHRLTDLIFPQTRTKKIGSVLSLTLLLLFKSREGRWEGGTGNSKHSGRWDEPSNYQLIDFKFLPKKGNLKDSNGYIGPNPPCL